MDNQTPSRKPVIRGAMSAACCCWMPLDLSAPDLPLIRPAPLGAGSPPYRPPVSDDEAGPLGGRPTTTADGVASNR